MKPYPLFRLKHPLKVGLIAAFAAIILSACSLAGDVTPPPGAVSAANLPPAEEPTIVPQVADSGLGYPSAIPSAADGAAVYAQHCVQCHGPTGAGDGPMAGQLQTPPTNLTDPQLARGVTPKTWFDTITQGNMDRFMPPFANALSEAERWDVTFYLFALNAPQTVVDAGKEIYAAKCAECHGETGKGDGPKAAGQLADLGDAAAMAGKSQSDLFAAITGGVGQAMPPFADLLTEDERWSAANYIRTFSYEYAEPGAVPAEARGQIAGQVANGTRDAPAPTGLDVVLYGFDQFALATTITETMQADGSFLFANVPYAPGRAFIVTTEYGGVMYSSDIGSFEAGTTQLDMPLKVYEVTPDPAALAIDRMHVFFDFAEGGSVTVGELFILSNTGDKTVIGAGLQFELPPGATGLNIQNATAGEDYVETSSGFTLTRPIPPGASAEQLLISFSLPYERKLAFSQRLPFPVGTVNLLVPDLGVKVSSDQLNDDGVRDVQGTQFQSYSGAALAAGSTLAFSLTGGTAAGGGSPLVGDTRSLLIGGLSLALVAAAVGWWLYSRRSPLTPLPEEEGDADALLQAVAELDDAFETGEVSKKEYERRRRNLIAELKRRWT